MRYMTVAGVAVLVVLVSGCSTLGPTASYDASKDQMVYESAKMKVAQMEAAIGPGKRIVMRAVASCRSRNCTPETVRLVFALDGQGGSAIADRSISIDADGTEYTWRSGELSWQRRGDVRSFQGELMQVELSFSEVEQIASASSISAYIGSIPLTLEGRTQSKLRSFVQTVRNPSSAESS